MPKIDAPTVAEHHRLVRTRLIDTAEKILRTRPAQPLTAGAVSAGAGIARNSIYRYVDSVDDLRGLVVDRYLPDWLGVVAGAMASAEEPGDRVVAWLRANLAQAAETGHGWLMEAARMREPTASLDQAVARAHTGMRDSLREAWKALLPADPDRAAIATGLTVGILEAGFRQIDAGRPAALVLEMGVAAGRALVGGLGS